MPQQPHIPANVEDSVRTLLEPLRDCGADDPPPALAARHLASMLALGTELQADREHAARARRPRLSRPRLLPALSIATPACALLAVVVMFHGADRSDTMSGTPTLEVPAEVQAVVGEHSTPRAAHRAGHHAATRSDAPTQPVPTHHSSSDRSSSTSDVSRGNPRPERGQGSSPTPIMSGGGQPTCTDCGDTGHQSQRPTGTSPTGASPTGAEPTPTCDTATTAADAGAVAPSQDGQGAPATGPAATAGDAGACIITPAPAPAGAAP